MRITSINNNYKPAFGHISKRTIDMIRSHIEGYRTDNKGNGAYSSGNGYQMLSGSQLLKISQLTKKASELQKSVIDTSGNNWESCNTVPVFTVRSHCYGGETRGNRAVFCIPYESVLDNSITPDEVIDKFEQAVDYAAEVEDDPCAHEMFDEYGWHGGVRESARELNYYDRFKTPEHNKVLNNIYDYTLNLSSIK